jgi:hypothetical protein
MDMVIHKTEGNNTIPESLVRFAENIVKTKPVPVIGKDLLPGITTEDHVVNGTICMNTRFARHVIKLPPSANLQDPHWFHG